MGQNSIGHIGCLGLGELLAANTKLKRLSLCSHINQFFYNRLHLDDNEVDDLGAEKLAYGLCKNGVLEWLSLGYNYIGDIGAGMLLDAGNKCVPLTVLGIGICND